MKKLNIAQGLVPYGGVTTPSLNTLAPPIPTYAEHGVRLACLYALPKGQRMKAVLEFTYPQDEIRLKHALKGEEYYLALVEIDRALMASDRDDMLFRINRILEGVLEE